MNRNFAQIDKIITAIDNAVWGLPLICLIMATGIFLTARLGLVQIRHLGKAFKFMFKDEEDVEFARKLLQNAINHCEEYRELIDKNTKKRALSHNRAQAVYKYLVAKRIEKKRMTFKGYGNTQPLGNGSEQDRRVEFLITKT